MDLYTGEKRPVDSSVEDDAQKRQKTGAPSKVLHVRGLPSHTTEQELAQVVGQFGTMVKCLIIGDKHQAFVQMDSVETAALVLSNLEFSAPSIRAKPIYLQYSSRQEVDTSNVTHSSQMGGMGAGGLMGGDAGPPPGPVILMTVSNVTVPVTLENIAQICKPYGEVIKIITFTKGIDFQALVQFNSPDAAASARMYLEGKDIFQGCCHIRVNYSQRPNIVVKENNAKSRDFTSPASFGGGSGMLNQYGDFGMASAMGLGGASQMGGGAIPNMPGMSAPQGSPCVLVNKLHEELTTCDLLFKLFGVYGDVMRVKRLYNKRGTALVQFRHPQSAQYAVFHLNGCPLFGENIQVTSSKHPEIKLPREGEEGSELTKDYTNSPAHRFRGRSMINPKNVNPPSSVLHVANLHDGCTEQELRDLFGPHDVQTPIVEFFSTSRKMAYVGLSSPAAAVAALLQLHNSNVGGYNIRVSFSHKEAQALKPSSEVEQTPEAAMATNESEN